MVGVKWFVAEWAELIHGGSELRDREGGLLDLGVHVRDVAGLAVRAGRDAASGVKVQRLDGEPDNMGLGAVHGFCGLLEMAFAVRREHGIEVNVRVVGVGSLLWGIWGSMGHMFCSFCWVVVP